MSNEEYPQEDETNLEQPQGSWNTEPRNNCSESSILKDIPAEVALLKVQSDTKIAERKIRLEEKRLEHKIAMDNRIEDFREEEALRLNKFMDECNSESWLRSYWRPVMGWIYALICLFDFVLAPIMVAVLPAFISGMTYEPWKSISLENGGIIHLAFAAILGVTAWTRGQENILKTKMTSNSLAVNSNPNGNGVLNE